MDKDDEVVEVVDDSAEVPEEAEAELVEEPGEAPAPVFEPWYVESLERKVEELQRRLEQTYSAHRVREAELEKIKERLERDREKRLLREKVKLFEQLLEPLDNLERSCHAAGLSQDLDSLIEGLTLVHKLFTSSVSALGLEKFAQSGDRFDPEVHDAISVAPVDSRADHDRIHTVFQAGYRLGDAIIRPARVVVGKYAR
jgi:molecular chaperone GrpE